MARLWNVTSRLCVAPAVEILRAASWHTLCGERDPPASTPNLAEQRRHSALKKGRRLQTALSGDTAPGTQSIPCKTQGCPEALRSAAAARQQTSPTHETELPQLQRSRQNLCPTMWLEQAFEGCRALTRQQQNDGAGSAHSQTNNNQTNNNQTNARTRRTAIPAAPTAARWRS